MADRRASGVGAGGGAREGREGAGERDGKEGETRRMNFVPV